MKEKKSLLKNPSFQSILTSLICIVLGLLIGYIVLLMINPAGAGQAIKTILLNFLTRSSSAARAKALGNTLAKTAPLLMCALSICFCYKVGLFNIGAPGQYEAGAVLGMTKTQIFFKVTLLQLVKRIIPPMGNEIITLVKDTSLARIISNKEIIMMAGEYTSKGLIWPLFSTGLFFLVFVGALTLLFGWLERKMDYFR